MRLLLAGFGLVLLTVPLAGGQLRRIPAIRFEATWLLLVALGGQFVAFKLLPHGPPLIHGAAHVATYLVAGAFLWRNRAIPGLWLVGLGGLGNLAAITANGGVMPAMPTALEAAGKAVVTERFVNSGVVANPKLALLGDIFAVPAGWPFANVFSVGDLCILLGAAVVLHRVAGSRLVPSGAGQFRELRGHGMFMRLWAAQGISNLGDWTYSLAVVTSLAGQTSGAHVFSALLIAQVAPAALTSMLGGPLIDRAPRKWIMVAADVSRALAVGSLLLTGEASLTHVYVVAGLLGLWGSVFQPAMQASLPNLVPTDRLVAANSLVAGTQNMAIMVGPLLGGLLVAHFGSQIAFSVNALSFLASAVLVMGLQIPRRHTPPEEGSPVRALVDGMRYAAATPLVRGILATLALVVLAAAIRSPLEPLFVLQALKRESTALGAVGAAWGFGMLLGSVAAPALSRRWRREQLLWVSVGVVGMAVIAASQARLLSPVLFLWLFAGGGNALGTIAYETLLQERTPDMFRGRVMAATEATVQVAFLVGALLAGWLGTAIGLRAAYALSGAGFILAALVARIVLRPGRLEALEEAAVDAARQALREDPPGRAAAPDAPALAGASSAAFDPATGWRVEPGSARTRAYGIVVTPDPLLARAALHAVTAAGWAADRAADVADLLAVLNELPVPTCLLVDVRTAAGQAALGRLQQVPRIDGVPVIALCQGGADAAFAAASGARPLAAADVAEPDVSLEAVLSGHLPDRPAAPAPAAR